MGRHTSLRWHNSLIVRVIALCVVLLLCLLGSVYVMTVHYYHLVVAEMETQAAVIAREIELWVEVRPEEEAGFESLPEELKALQEQGRLSLDVVSEAGEENPITPFLMEDGYVTTTAQYFDLGEGQWMRATALIVLAPQAAVVTAFKDQYLVALSLGFLAALGLMVYLIAKTLRPLRELSETCGEIMEGNLRNVAVRGNSGEILALEETFNRMVESLREKEKVEANLRQAQRLSAVGNLAAGVAHDVRNPLNAIKLLSGHALDTLEDSPEDSAKQLRTIRNEVDRLEEIVSGFLSLAREEELQRGPSSIDAILAECAQLVKKDAEAREIKFDSELRTGETMLHLDPKQWTRAVINVLINALEVCPAQGRVRLFSRVVEGVCEIEIRDDGPGMPKEVLERAFDPYFTTKATGTGLGLSITRGIVEEHGGTIKLLSTEGQGCQVLIRMPLSPEPDEDRGAARTSEAEGSLGEP